MTPLPAALRNLVFIRAGHRCEMCLLSQAGQEATFHVDDIVPRASGGVTTEDNLALACVSCSLHKAANQSGIDPDSGEIAPFFNPRTQNWSEHFRWDGVKAVGLSSTGRATIAALKINRSLALAIRREEAMRARHPYP